jgi:DNA-binding response OmpR family regulator
MARVLLVEDESDVRELIEEAFAERGFKVRAAATDQEAYDLLGRETDAYDLLIADINLGTGTTGFDVARRARQLRPGLPVIYITGHAAHLERFGVDGAVMFPKPFNPRELADQAEQAIEVAGGRALRR